MIIKPPSIVALIGYNSAMRVMIIKIVHVCERIIIIYIMAQQKR